MEKEKLRIWWIPQVPMKAFRVEVETPQEAKKLLEILANYDIFQFENKIKPDYSNVGGLESYDQESKEWSDWYDEKTGKDIDEIKF